MTVAGKRVAVLGDMKELGDFSLAAHQAVGRAVVEAEIDTLITVGTLAEEIAEEAARYAVDSNKPKPVTYRFRDSAETVSEIKQFVQHGDAVLVKGSRAMQMEKIVAALMGEKDSGHDV